LKDVEEYVLKGFKSEKVTTNRMNQFLVCQEITGTIDKYRLHFAITDQNENFLFGHTANKLSVKNNESIKALAVILNSHFLDWLFRKTSTNNHVMGYEITQFPIPKNYKISITVLEKIYYVLEFLSQSKALLFDLFENIMDSVVYELYFPNHMKERKIDILQFVKKGIKEVIQNRDFDQLTNDQKEKVIKQLHTKWSDPKSEIVKRMNSFAEKSPDILKPILESK